MGDWIKGSKQKLFDHVVAKLHEQGRKCFGLVSTGYYPSMPSCAYKGPGTDRCAAGHCMTKAGLEKAHRQEGTGILELEGFERHPHAGFLYSLQNAHDEAATRAQLVQNLRAVAVKYELSGTALRAMSKRWQAAGGW